MIDVYVYIVNLPSGINEMVTPDTDDDGYTIYIDDKLTYEGAEKAYLHALKHINNNDFEKSNVNDIEITAHKLE
jgi:hypothetical protein